MDKNMRELERRAKAGDPEAVAALARAKDRAGFSSIDAEYLQAYLQMCEEVVSLGPSALRDQYDYDDGNETLRENSFAQRLKQLNEQAKAAGVSPTLIRKEFIAEDALTNRGSWYNSSMGC